MKFLTIDFSVEDSIAIITLNRSQVMNALNKQFFVDLNQLIDNLGDHQNPPVLIITGNGKAFAAGADVSEMIEMTPEEARDFSRVGQRVLSRLESYPMPVIAAINGYALGGGLELALACDIRLASSDVQLGMPEASLGLIPGFGGTQRLPRMAGLNNALYLLLTSQTISAGQAKNMGLIQQTCQPGELMKLARDTANKIVQMGPQAVQTLKKIVRKGSDLPLKDAMDLESDGFHPLFEMQGRIGMRAFLEKKKPSWTISK
jgi:enoyl-CoA hydratase